MNKNTLHFDNNTICSIIKGAGESVIRPYFRSLEKGDIRKKEGGEVVTIADEKTEQYLIQHLIKEYPETTFVGEETMAKNPSISSRINTDEWVWIIDPIDGTINFATGKPLFCIILSLIHYGETVAAWMFDVMNDRMFASWKGQGVTVNGKNVQSIASSPGSKELSDMVGYTRPQFFPRRYRDTMKENISCFKDITSHRCASHDYIGMIDGKADFSLYNKMKPWDHLAGSLMIEELGGKVARVQGEQPYRADSFLDPDARGLLIASSPDLWDTVYNTIFKNLAL